MHFAVLAGDEQAAAGHGGLRARRAHVGVAEGPFEFQPRQVRGRELADLGRLEAIGGGAIAMSVPARAARGIAHGRVLRALVDDHACAGGCRSDNRLPVANSDTPRRCASLSVEPWCCILPLVSAVSTASGVNCRSCARVGAFSLGLPAGAGVFRVAEGALGIEDQLVFRTLGPDCGNSDAKTQDDQSNPHAVPRQCSWFSEGKV